MGINMPYDERNDETGQFTSTYTSDDFLDALRVIDDGATTREVGEQVKCAYRTALFHLTDLESEGRVQSRDIGASKLWTLSEDSETDE